MSSHQQDLPDTTLFRSGLSFGCLAGWKLAADRDHQFAISNGFGHELESFRIRFRDHRHHLHRCVLRGILRWPENRRKHSSLLHLGDQLLGGFAADQPMNADCLAKHFRSIIKAAGLPRIRLYDLRHTAATLALAAGVSPKVVSEQLGHASTAFTLDTYAHVLPHMQDEAAAKVEAMLFGTASAVAN